MAKPWSEVALSSGYQALPPDQQATAKQQYFASQIAPRVPEAEHAAAWQQFDAYKPSPKKIDDASSRSMPAPPLSDQRVGLGKGLAREATEGGTFGWGDEIGLGAESRNARVPRGRGLPCFRRPHRGWED